MVLTKRPRLDYAAGPVICVSIVFPLGAFGLFFGPDMVILGGLQVLFIVGLVLLARFLARRGRTAGTKPPKAPRLRTLEALRQDGVVSEAEYAEQRRRIVAEI